MILTSVHLSFTRNAQTRWLKTIKFMLNGEEVNWFDTVLDTHLILDSQERQLIIDEKPFKFILVEESEDKHLYKIRVNNKVFMRILYYATSHFEFNNNMKDDDEHDLLLDILKKLRE